MCVYTQIGHFEGIKTKSSNISRNGEAMPTKISLRAFCINLYLHEFFEPILFFLPPWSEEKILVDCRNSKLWPCFFIVLDDYKAKADENEVYITELFEEKTQAEEKYLKEKQFITG